MQLRPAIAAIAGVLASGFSARAQRGPSQPAVTVRGLAYDSLRRTPLRDAFISILGRSRNTTTDSRGRFHFDSVEPGSYTFAIQHAIIDSIGFPGLTARAKVSDGRDEVVVAVPSYETLWRRACGGKPPRDSGFVYGSIRDAETRAVVPHANIYVSWLDLLIDKRKRNVTQRDWQGRTRSDSTGTYTLCGVPMDVVLRVQATHDSAASGVVDLQPRELRVERLDLLIGPVLSTDSTRVGTIVGMISDVSGAPFADARVGVEGVRETRTGQDGRFTLPSIPAGSRQLSVMYVGMEPMQSVVHVVAHDTAVVALTFGKVTLLEMMRTTAANGARIFAAEFEQRRKAGFGYTRDSLTIIKYPDFVNVLREVPGLNTRYGAGILSITVPNGEGGFCAPDVKIDGAPAAFGHLIDLFPKEVAALEVYPRAGTVPTRFAPSGIKPLCGMILVWTKYGFANR
jgi:hypothetical protein